jgi:hypothetical protein
LQTRSSQREQSSSLSQSAQAPSVRVRGTAIAGLMPGASCMGAALFEKQGAATIGSSAAAQVSIFIE